jgi:hypothetical protein
MRNESSLQQLTDEQKEEIWRMFFGPYKKAWKNTDGIVDNTDATIAKRLGLNTDVVGNYISMRLKRHMIDLNHVPEEKVYVENKNNSNGYTLE